MITTPLLSNLSLNSQIPDGMPHPIIMLKAGCMVMLMRNVHKALGLASGAKLIVRDFQPRCVDCRDSQWCPQGQKGV